MRTPRRVTPMIHVPDVAAAVAWYRSIGFTVLDVGEDDGEAVWAHVAFGEGRVMFSAGGSSRFERACTTRSTGRANSSSAT